MSTVYSGTGKLILKAIYRRGLSRYFKQTHTTVVPFVGIYRILTDNSSEKVRKEM